jgi:hypothetical protein
MKQLLHNNKAEGGGAMIGTVIALLVSIIIGLLVWYKIDQGITAGPRTAAVGTLYNTTNTSANTIFTLFPIIAIVVIAGIILSIVTNFGRGAGQ